MIFAQGLNCSLVVEMVNNVKALYNETELLLAGKMALVRTVNSKKGFFGSSTTAFLTLLRR